MSCRKYTLYWMKRVIDTYEFVNVIVFVFRISPLWDRFSAIENFCGKLKFSRRATQQKLKCICTYCLLKNKKWYSSVFKRTCSKQRNQGSVRVHHPFMEGDSPRKYKTTAEAAADCRYVVSLVIWFPVQFIPRKHIVFFRSGEIGLGDRGEISTKHQEPTERARSSSEVSISIHSSVICRSNLPTNLIQIICRHYQSIALQFAKGLAHCNYNYANALLKHKGGGRNLW